MWLVDEVVYERLRAVAARRVYSPGGAVDAVEGAAGGRQVEVLEGVLLLLGPLRALLPNRVQQAEQVSTEMR